MHFQYCALALLIATYANAVALPKLPPLLRGRGNVHLYAWKYQKNCQKDNMAAREKDYWDSMQKLGSAAQLWKANGAYQSTADLYFGKDSAANYDRIMSKCYMILLRGL